MNSPGPWDEAQWLRARAAHALREEFLLPEYLLLSFAAMDERLRYVLADDKERANMLAAVRWQSGVVTRDSRHHFVEIGRLT
jgi:hypothetical protein